MEKFNVCFSCSCILASLIFSRIPTYNPPAWCLKGHRERSGIRRSCDRSGRRSGEDCHWGKESKGLKWQYSSAGPGRFPLHTTSLSTGRPNQTQFFGAKSSPPCLVSMVLLSTRTITRTSDRIPALSLTEKEV